MEHGAVDWKDYETQIKAKVTVSREDDIAQLETALEKLESQKSVYNAFQTPIVNEESLRQSKANEIAMVSPEPKHMKKKQRQLEEKVDIRTSDINKNNQTTKRLNDVKNVILFNNHKVFLKINRYCLKCLSFLVERLFLRKQSFSGF